MKRISIDMDGVIANVYSQFAKMYAAETGKVKTAYKKQEVVNGSILHEVQDQARNHRPTGNI